MCGISVLVQKNGLPVDREKLEIINKSINHRGPDSEGYYINRNVGLGHQRLSIIDLTEMGNQPMKIDQNIIVFNGEIYNYIEIKNKLIEIGISFESNSDTEVILKAYQKWGIKCFELFNGMWSIVIFNEKKNELIISRDRFGIKPLYFYEDNDILIFASEIKQIIPQINDKLTANGFVLLDYLAMGYENHGPETFFNKIKRFPSSTITVIDLNNFSRNSTKFYELSKQININNNKSKVISKYYSIFKKSVLLRLRSDVRVGACLSGGLDSSSIVAIASREYKNKEPFMLFHIHTSNDDEYSELKYVKELTKDLNVELIKINVDDNLIKDFIEDTIQTQEEPFGSPSVVLQYILMKTANKYNCKVLLDGQGGDETLLGYERYFPAVIVSASFYKIPMILKNIVYKSGLSLRKIIYYLLYFTSKNIRLWYILYRNNFLLPSLRKKINKKLIKDSAKNYKNIKDLQRQELFSTQLPHLLRYEDKNSMKFSIETRLPFLDYNLVDYSFLLPLKYKIRNGWTKYVLRKSMNKLMPKNITWRKNKMGFELPERDLIASIGESFKSDILESKLLYQLCDMNKVKTSFDKLNKRTLWRMYNIAKWEKLFNIHKCTFND